DVVDLDGGAGVQGVDDDRPHGGRAARAARDLQRDGVSALVVGGEGDGGLAAGGEGGGPAVLGHHPVVGQAVAAARVGRGEGAQRDGRPLVDDRRNAGDDGARDGLAVGQGGSVAGREAGGRGRHLVAERDDDREADVERGVAEAVGGDGGGAEELPRLTA